MRKRFFLIITLFLFSISSIANTVILRHMSVKNSMHHTYVTFYLSASTPYRSFMLHHPDRFVIDLKNVKMFRALHFPFQGQSSIIDFKYATHRDGFFRLVFGMASSHIPTIRALNSDQYHQARLQVTFQNATTVLTSPQQHRDIIIVVDPGHGGKDPGATGPGGTHEKTIVLSIGKKIQRLINQQPGFHADLTRTGDYYLTLRQRLRIARKDKADMFIAIHADIWRNTRARGVSVFALSQKGATSEAARWLAARENASELMGGVDLQDQSHLLKSVLINLSQAATIRSSLKIGNDLLKTIQPITRLHHDRVEQAAFVVLKSPDIPSLLVETGFLSNPREEHRLRSQTFQNKLAEAISQGIFRYFITHSPRGTWLSYWKNHHGMFPKNNNTYYLR